MCDIFTVKKSDISCGSSDVMKKWIHNAQLSVELMVSYTRGSRYIEQEHLKLGVPDMNVEYNKLVR